MKLLIVSQYFWPENFKINDLVQELVARGHELTVLTGKPSYPDRDGFSDFYAAPERFVRYKGARVVRVPLMARSAGPGLFLNYLTFAVTAAFLGPIKLRMTEFDCIFVFEPSPVTVGIPAILLRRLRQVPMVFWVQDLWPETLSAVGVITSSWLLALIRRFVRFIYDRCDLILAQSRSFVPRIASNCAHPDRVAYFPNWAEPIYGLGDGEAAREVPSAEGKFTVMFAGNIGDAQNFPAILDAVEHLRDRGDVRFIIVGDGRISDWVASEIRRRGLADMVLMLGRFAVERMPSFFRHADALLVSLKPDPVLSATVPAKLQTYLAAGIPVLAMMNGEGATLVQEAGAGLVCAAGDAKGLADAVSQLASFTVEERRMMGARGRNLAAAEFDRAKQIDKLVAWLSELKYSDRRTL
ncbi:glycosyltransferase family 4 protein [Bradyrhizobium lablabi]|uniref:glycosyltransferase family 4 protein n=1 Tax=Bradyrhizobium lablabi TaxID=722472 RepID=UPI00090B2113|nr:glycosyltransferase family 4 protein [Bradyrhizobium lablabi]SHM80803.1 Glycosyltransferase involved in cell wall bisynthesis [Bradyrhizobium lablabi]